MKYTKLSIVLLVLFVLLGGTKMDALGFLGLSNTLSWKEEVQLHDGTKIIVLRSLIRKGRHEIGQMPPIKEHSITFTLPGSDKPITWASEYTEDIGHSNFGLLALDIVNGVPYIVSSLTGCLAYNKWGRPNPPYIFFKYENQQWKQIPLAEFPIEIKQPNVLLYLDDKQVKTEEKHLGYVSADSIKKLNSSLKQEYLKSILRTPLKPGSAGVSCPEMVFYKGAWVGPGDSIGRRMMDRKNK